MQLNWSFEENVVEDLIDLLAWVVVILLGSPFVLKRVWREHLDKIKNKRDIYLEECCKFAILEIMHHVGTGWISSFGMLTVIQGNKTANQSGLTHAHFEKALQVRIEEKIICAVPLPYPDIELCQQVAPDNCRCAGRCITPRDKRISFSSSEMWRRT